jgi:hypothetical protein
MRRHDGAGIAEESIIRTPGIRRLRCVVMPSGGEAPIAAPGHAVRCTTNPNWRIIASRILNFCTLPLAVVGNSCTNRM